MDIKEYVETYKDGFSVSVDIFQNYIEEAVLAEREACAKIADQHTHNATYPDCDCDYCIHGQSIADAIRARTHLDTLVSKQEEALDVENTERITNVVVQMEDGEICVTNSKTVYEARTRFFFQQNGFCLRIVEWNEQPREVLAKFDHPNDAFDYARKVLDTSVSKQEEIDE